MSKIIGFGHKKRVGKDTACELLWKKLTLSKQSSIRVSFAECLYDMCYMLFPEMHEKIVYEMKPEIKNNIVEQVGKTHRQILIEVGNKMREVYENVWIDKTLSRLYSDAVLLISDVRYPNEVKAIHEAGGIVIKIERDCVIPTDDVADCALDGFDGWDYTIKNNSSLEFLSDSVWQIAQSYLEDKK